VAEPQVTDHHVVARNPEGAVLEPDPVAGRGLAAIVTPELVIRSPPDGTWM
jgi:hypothetical protein